MSTLEAAALLAELNARGIAVAATPRGSLRCTPKSAITEDTLEKIREHKPELLSLITQKNPSSPIVPTVPPTDNPDTYRESRGTIGGDDPEQHIVPRFVREEEERRRRAGENLGLVARWSPEFGYVSIHDPLGGEWHDLRTREAPDWSIKEAWKRKALFKAGNLGAYRMTASELEGVWKTERDAETAREEGIVDGPPAAAATEGGILFEDYLEED